MKLSPEEIRQIAAILSAETRSFVELVKIADLNPARDLVGSDLRGVNFWTDDLSGYDFSGANLSGANLSMACGLNPSMVVNAVFDETTLWPENWTSQEVDHLKACAQNR